MGDHADDATARAIRDIRETREEDERREKSHGPDEQNNERMKLTCAMVGKTVMFVPTDWAWLCQRAESFDASVADIIHRMVALQQRRDERMKGDWP